MNCPFAFMPLLFDKVLRVLEVFILCGISLAPQYYIGRLEVFPDLRTGHELHGQNRGLIVLVFVVLVTEGLGLEQDCVVSRDHMTSDVDVFSRTKEIVDRCAVYRHGNGIASVIRAGRRKPVLDFAGLLLTCWGLAGDGYLIRLGSG